jgi:AcrR family transcriptional regulator
MTYLYKKSEKPSLKSKKFTAQKNHIYEKGLQLFKNKGYDKTSVQEIAAASSLQKGSLYHYISSKENLLFEMIYRTVNTMVEMIENVKKEDLPPRQKLRRAIKMHLLSGTDFLDEFSLMMQETKYLSPKLKKRIILKKKQYDLAFREMIEEGIKKGELKKLDTKVISFIILGALNWLYQWYSSKGPLSPQQISDIFCEVILSGICKD